MMRRTITNWLYTQKFDGLRSGLPAWARRPSATVSLGANCCLLPPTLERCGHSSWNSKRLQCVVIPCAGASPVSTLQVVHFARAQAGRDSCTSPRWHGSRTTQAHVQKGCACLDFPRAALRNACRQRKSRGMPRVPVREKRGSKNQSRLSHGPLPNSCSPPGNRWSWSCRARGRWRRAPVRVRRPT